jgi:hypothetical protein
MQHTTTNQNTGRNQNFRNIPGHRRAAGPQDQPASNQNARIDEGATDRIAEGEGQRMFHKATTPEERADRFAKLATQRTRRAIRAVRLIGELVTAYAVFDEPQKENLIGALNREVNALDGAMDSHLKKGTTIQDVDFQL